jgi:hypothetical protein
MTKLGLLVMLCAATPAMADSPAPVAAPAMPKPSADLDAWKPMLKSWSCTGTNPAGEKGSAKITIKKELDGFWFSLRFEVAKSKMMPAFIGMAMIGQDPVKKDWQLEGWDNMGGTLHVRSKDGMAWTGTSIDQGKETPASLTFAMDAKTKHTTFQATINGQKIFDYDCK